MSIFRTPVSIPPAALHFGLSSPFLTVGSCFADAIGNRLTRAKFVASVNPFGTTYHPVSIHTTLTYAMRRGVPPPDSYLQAGDIHVNYLFHSDLSALSRTDLELLIAGRIQATHEFLRRAKCIVITYGTAFAYQLNNSGTLVANCHKQPSREFRKVLSTTEEIVSSFNELYIPLKKEFPSLRMILTVSPVRHWKDTLTLNSVSKSVLRVACHQLAGLHADVEYFPAYEIMMDDLRDYRFYKRDMIHPTEEAEDYIWAKFAETYLDDDARTFLQQWNEIQNALQHRPFHPQSAGHQIFLRKILSRLEQLKNIVNVDEEIQSIRNQLSDLTNP